MKKIILFSVLLALVGCGKSNDQKSYDVLIEKQSKLEKELKDQEFVANKHLKPCQDGVNEVIKLKQQGRDDLAQQVANKASSHCDISKNAAKKSQDIALELLEIVGEEAVLQQRLSK